MQSDILTTIPFAKDRCDQEYRNEIRKLRNIIISEFPNKRILAFTSINPDAGKSTITEELAYLFAEYGKVLAIDADPYNPSLHGHLPGLSEYLTGAIDLNELTSYINKVDFICSGARPFQNIL